MGNLVIGELVNYVISKNGKGVVLIHGFTDKLIRRIQEFQKTRPDPSTLQTLVIYYLYQKVEVPAVSSCAGAV